MHCHFQPHRSDRSVHCNSSPFGFYSLSRLYSVEAPSLFLTMYSCWLGATPLCVYSNLLSTLFTYKLTTVGNNDEPMVPYCVSIQDTNLQSIPATQETVLGAVNNVQVQTEVQRKDTKHSTKLSIIISTE